MKKIISIEIQKTLSYPVFWVFTGILLGLFFLFTLSTSYFEINFFGAEVDIQNYFRFPHIWNTFTWIASWFNHILALIIIILITNEFNFRTFKQGLIDGLNRNEIISGKIFIILGLAVSFTLVIFLTTLIFGAFNTDNISNVFDKIYFLGIYLIQTIGIMSFAMLVAFIFRNTALSIIVYLGYYIFEAIFRLILRLSDIGIFQYFPMKIITNLTPRPSLSVAFNQQDYSQYVESVENVYVGPDIIIIISFAIVYIAVFTFASFVISRKRNF
jgi:ABC-type transport system involved in multi-copper enzyme maturation permease subunit